MSDHTASQQNRIGELAESFVARFRAGERPSIEEYALKYPHLADELRQLLPALVMLEQHGAPEGDIGNAARAAGLRQIPREIGDFTIVRELGRGGMGVVYEAVQQSLGRHVALKVLSSPSILNPVHLERFRLEARSAGRLHHSHIVPVFGVGESDGLHYYAMQFIAGQSLDQVIDALRKVRPHLGGDKSAPPVNGALEQSIASGLLSRWSRKLEESSSDSAARLPGATSPAEASNDAPAKSASLAGHSEFSSGSSGRPFFESVARVGLQVAEALAYAHAEGILHRDIKPSNLILDAKGNTWVTDFGLVKAEDTQSLTETGDFVGTLRYMAPERLDGWSDRRSDIYGLGVTLYELLTLHTFFEHASRGQLIDCIRHEQPKPPTKTDPSIPRDLETIVLKALAKEPGSRYHTAEEMAEDLRRFLSDRPILARRSTARERFVRWCRRSPAVASLATAVVVLLASAVTILAVSNARIKQQAELARMEAARSEQVAHILKDMLSAAGPSVARGRDATMLREILDKTAQRISRDLGDQPAVQGDLWMTLGTTSLDIGDYPRAITMFEQAVASYGRVAPREEKKLAVAYGSLGQCQCFVGQVPAGRANSEKGLAIARDCGDPQVLASCLMSMARSFSAWNFTVPESAPYAREALLLRQGLGDVEATSSCMAWLSGCLSDTEEGEQLGRDAVALCRTHLEPDHPRLAGSLLVLGQTLLHREKAAEAESVLRETFELYRTVHDSSHPYQTIVPRFLARSLALQGKWRDAEGAIRDAYPQTDADTRLFLVGIHVHQHQWSQAADEQTRIVESIPNDLERLFELAVILCCGGRDEEYRKRCQELLSRSGNLNFAYRAALAALLLPVEGEDFQRACQLADSAAVNQNAGPWMMPTKALADYRRNQFEAAIDWCNRATVSGEATPQSKSAAWIIQALAYARLQQTELTREALFQSSQLGDQPRLYLANDVDVSWRDWAIVELLRKEAAPADRESSSATTTRPTN